ncbi:TAXI family TRAP transporter solute-binding subunit [Curvibacter sp. HBC28]|uniref:TAXI family TRAP transporter solute-binding subunit n=1 Tax=Curvibacter microcysteis TaxID=3026419 RepID=A0ABT5MFA5_9BURK|nr:TAXI family TRAP transporter solute-binding subunit [Curvibacter sp. HBC28]MDD0814684.1 TAXI family TRAP transporter solute-binding subunit [Curvibacter sp. HBC28]
MSSLSRTLRYYLLNLRDLLLSAGPIALLPVLLLWGAYTWLNPTPPRQVTLATGPAQSAYERFGKAYAEALAREGIEVKLLPSDGSAANLQLLAEGQADLGFVQGGTATANPTEADEELQSLGSLFMEPLWVFYRPASYGHVGPNRPLTSLAQLRGLRVNVGAQGSGAPALMTQLLKANGVEPSALKLSQLAQTPATVAFLGGELDAVVFASAPESPLVQMLLQTPGVFLMAFGQSEAYARRFPFLTPVTLPRGVVDLARDIPSRDARLVASTTSLLVRADTHPALQQLFAQTARSLHGNAGWFNRAGEFPNLNHNELPLSREAERAYTEGPSWLQRHLPFWLANLVQRMGLALGVVLAIVLPLSRVIPPLYTFRVRSRVFRWYGRLRDIEARLDQGEATPAALLQELAEVEQQVTQIHLPLSYTDELYALRSHLQWVRRRLAGGPASQPPLQPPAPAAGTEASPPAPPGA